MVLLSDMFLCEKSHAEYANNPVAFSEEEEDGSRTGSRADSSLFDPREEFWENREREGRIQECLDNTNTNLSCDDYEPIVNDCDDNAREMYECLEEKGFKPEHYRVKGNSSSHAIVIIRYEDQWCLIDWGRAECMYKDKVIPLLRYRYQADFTELVPWSGIDVTEDVFFCADTYSDFGGCADCCGHIYRKIIGDADSESEVANVEGWYWTCRRFCPKPK